MKHPLILYFSSEIFLSTGIGIVQYAQPFFYVSHHATDGMVGTLLAVNAICGGLAALLLGPAADRIGASKVWKLSSALLGLGYLLTSLTHTTPLWMLTSALVGLAAALLMSTENVVLSSLSQEREKAGILSKFVAMYMFVIGAGNVLSGWMCAAWGYQSALAAGAVVALCAMPLRWFVKAPDAIAPTAFRAPSRRILAMSGYACLFGMGSALLNQFATLILHNQFSLGTHATSLVSAAATFMVSLGSLMVSMLIRRFRRNTTLALSYLSFIGLTAGLVFTRTPGLFSGLYLARTVTTSIPGPIVDATFLDLTPSTDFSQMFGVRVFGTNVGTAAGSYAGGGLLGHHQVAMISLLSAVTFAVAGAYLFVLLRQLSRRAEQEALAGALDLPTSG
ncbi:MFS transporter [Alicyclobacillus cycloheptanicus]|uniref:MFS family permease n=1 Tax=Alicyclobacillus cycloheptanicus TaxID=1457 RepID=A0ABT9XGB7_9BACL|nr:MFS transporter [Alicyclobacillus cycloheptanicus]MDQ0189338.1 MFS family permease [Alicyclobacillus cycloheptanicus]WDM01306.1 MFS transporter [Alicyclobacillus cycloheptanicus]